MATIACRSCGLPRAEELLNDVACPVCGLIGDEPVEAATDTEPMHDRAWVIPEPSRVPISYEPAKSRFLLGFLAGVAVALGGAFAWPFLVGRAVPDIDEPGPARPTEDPAREVAQAPAPREVFTSLRISAPSVPERISKPTDVPEPMIVLPPEPAPRNPFRPDAPRAIVLDRVQHFSPNVPPGSTVAVRGWVKTLIVKDLEGGAVLDCSALEAEQVIVIGKIEGGSRLEVRAPGGTVAFRSKVDGRSHVIVQAPGGTVTFETPTGMGRDGSKIDGGSEVEIHAKAVGFRGLIAGAKTKVNVTLSANGSLTFAEIDGTARLEYGKLDPDDAEPMIAKGRIGAAAVVKKVE